MSAQMGLFEIFRRNKNEINDESDLLSKSLEDIEQELEDLESRIRF